MVRLKVIMVDWPVLIGSCLVTFLTTSMAFIFSQGKKETDWKVAMAKRDAAFDAFGVSLANIEQKLTVIPDLVNRVHALEIRTETE